MAVMLANNVKSEARVSPLLMPQYARQRLLSVVNDAVGFARLLLKLADDCTTRS